MQYGINPANLHEFTKEIVTYFEAYGFDVIAELSRVSDVLSHWSNNSADSLDALANTIDCVILDSLMQQYTNIQVQEEHTKKEVKPKKVKDVE